MSLWYCLSHAVPLVVRTLTPYAHLFLAQGFNPTRWLCPRPPSHTVSRSPVLSPKVQGGLFLPIPDSFSPVPEVIAPKNWIV